MNDAQIRERFHRTRLRRQHADADTLIVDELGLRHGRCRADIAVINGHLIGYEIKSDEDSLCRLGDQVEAYSEVFDRAFAVVAARHADAVYPLLPDWWGIILSRRGPRGGISFETARAPCGNRAVKPLSVAQLLWRNEVTGILVQLGVPHRVLRQRREVLYQLLLDFLTPADLHYRVITSLRNRKNWRCPLPPSPGDGSSQLFST